MNRHFGRGAARARALQERRQIAAEAVDVSERVLGRCTLCGAAHGWPDQRMECLVCGQPRCFAGGCECGEIVTMEGGA